MTRLTKRTEDGDAFVIFKYTRQFGEIADKLAMYEDLEELLESAYGKCPGLLEEAIKHLVKHEGAEFENPVKSILLTDEDADRWLSYKSLDEQGLLAKLPCKVGDTLWTNARRQGWYFRLKDAPYRVQVVFVGLNDSEEMGGGLFNVCYEKHDHMMQFNFSDIGKRVFLTREEAEKALLEKEV